MIIVRPENIDDQLAIQAVDAAAAATLHQIYRPNQKALVNKAQVHTYWHRLVAIIDSHVVGTVQYQIADQSVRIMG